MSERIQNRTFLEVNLEVVQVSKEKDIQKPSNAIRQPGRQS